MVIEKDITYLVKISKLVDQLVLHMSMMKTWDCNPPTDYLNEEFHRLTDNIYNSWERYDC